MIKKALTFFLALSLFIGLCACGQEGVSSAPAPVETAEPTPNPTPEPTLEPTPEPTPEAFDPVASAEKIAFLMAKHDYEAVLARANSSLKGMVDANYLYTMWDGLVYALGEFESVNSQLSMTGEYMGYTTATAFCEFSEGGLGVIALFDADDKLDSLMFNYYTPIDQYVFGESSDSTPLMWRVSDDNGNELYLFGSYHMGQADFYPLPEAVMSAYEESDALAVEYDMFAATFDIGSLVEIQNAMLYTDGSTVADHLREDTYKMAVELMTEKGVYNASLDSYKASQWSTLLLQILAGELGQDSTHGVDNYLLTLAHHQGKKVLEVESQSQQIELLTSTSDLYNDASIRSAVMNFEESRELLLELYEAYRCGNEAELARLLLEEEDVEDEAMAAYTAEEQAQLEAEAEAYDKAMMDDRNYGMAEKAEEYLASGETVFFVVGAAHMLGETGLVQLLTEAGYTVEKVEY